MNTPEENKRKLREIRHQEAEGGPSKRGHDPTKKKAKGNRNFKAGANKHFVSR